MKRRIAPDRPSLVADTTPAARLQLLIEALQALQGSDEMRRFLVDLCTPAELEALADRWAVVPELVEGRAYRDIHERTGVSVTTIGRVARCLSLGAGGYRRAAERLAERGSHRVQPTTDKL